MASAGLGQGAPVGPYEGSPFFFRVTIVTIAIIIIVIIAIIIVIIIIVIIIVVTIGSGL